MPRMTVHLQIHVPVFTRNRVISYLERQHHSIPCPFFARVQVLQMGSYGDIEQAI